MPYSSCGLQVARAGGPTAPRARVLPQAYMQAGAQRISRRGWSAMHCSADRTVFSFETKRLAKTVLTRQAVKSLLHYLSETNGQLHYFLHNYVSANPIPLDGKSDADEWIVNLAATPLTQVIDPRRSSVASAAAAAAVTNGVREVSPREIAERLLSLREHIAKEMIEDLGGVPGDNANIMKRCLEKTFTTVSFDDRISDGKP